MPTEIVSRQQGDNGADKETLYMLGGLALVIFGAGLVLSNSTVRRYLSQIGFGDVVAGSIPDIERYFRLRSM